MIRFLMMFLCGALALPLADYLLPGLYCPTLEAAVVSGAVLMLLYMLVRPVLRLLLGLFNLLTLGLLYAALDAGLIYFLSLLTPRLVYISSIWWAFAAAVIINAVRALSGALFKRR